jgi:hypothetical protein
VPDRLIRITGTVVVLGVAIVSYEHAYALVREHGEDGWTARVVPFTVKRAHLLKLHGHAGLGQAAKNDSIWLIEARDVQPCRARGSGGRHSRGRIRNLMTR